MKYCLLTYPAISGIIMSIIIFIKENENEGRIIQKYTS